MSNKKVPKRSKSEKTSPNIGSRSEKYPLIFALTQDQSPETFELIKRGFFEGIISEIKTNWVKTTLTLLMLRDS